MRKKLLLEEVVTILEKQKSSRRDFQVALPLLWLSVKTPAIIKKNKKEFFVNPYDYLSALIQQYYLPKVQAGKDYHQSLQLLEKQTKNHGQWIKKAVLYSALIRASAAYDLDGSGKLEQSNAFGLKETGTFIKMLFVLPHLVNLGVDVLYLLPIGKHAELHKKGDLGSPYAIVNFSELDENLSDPLVSDYLDIQQQFSVLVEACHILGIRVIIDIIPRTNGLHSDLIVDHPDWFYWLDTAAISDYKAPYAPGLPVNSSALPEYLPQLFASKEVQEHILKFADHPAKINPALWEKTRQQHHQDSQQVFLSLVENNFGLSVAPAFSDCINDLQPPWSDVTYLRLYFDHPINSQPYLNFAADIKPYILYDTAKASLNPGSLVNAELWHCLSEIIPTYQKRYGIDGARIDMGHALPEDLVALIIDKARSRDANFSFIAEELSSDRADYAKAQRYNCIVGNGFTRLVSVADQRLQDFFYQAKDVALPLFAAVETHDTHRIANRAGKKKLAKLTTLLNYFIPNTITFINSGQELYEIQPMNLGLDCQSADQFVLPKNDPYYGKLALFDAYQFHYDNDYADLLAAIYEVKEIRKTYVAAICDSEKALYLYSENPQDLMVAVAYPLDYDYLLVLANLDLNKKKAYKLKLDNLTGEFAADKLQQLFTSSNNAELSAIIKGRQLEVTLQAAELKIVKLPRN